MNSLPLVELEGATIAANQRLLFAPVTLRVLSGDVWLIDGATGSGKSLLFEVISGLHRLTLGTRSYPAFVEQFPDARLGIPPRFALRLVSQEQQRRLALGQATFHQARWHHQWTAPISVEAFLSPPNVMGLKAYEHFEDLPVRRDFDAERNRMLDLMQLSEHRSQSIGQLSNGELRKLLLIAAHLAAPRVLLLDDPLGGLDPSARQQTLALIRHWAGDGRTLLLSSTHPEEFAGLAAHYLTLSREPLRGSTSAPKPLPTAENLPHAVAATPTASGTKCTPEAGGSDVVIRCHRVNVVADSKKLLDNVDWEVRKHEHWLVTGENGAGKSTLLAVITGDHPQAYANDIEVFGKRLGKDVNLWTRRRSIGFVSPELGWHYPANWRLSDVVLSGFEASIGQYRQAGADECAAAARWLATIGLSQRADEPLAAVSESERRLLLLARAMVAQPRLLLLDEPTQGLAAPERDALFGHLDSLASNQLTTIVMVSHHPEQHPACINRRLHLEAGRVAGAWSLA
jgi:molybdate transport system ATP-binding protein